MIGLHIPMNSEAKKFVACDKLYKLLEYALPHFDEVSAKPNVTVDMSVWYQRTLWTTREGLDASYRCTLCLAGAAIAGFLPPPDISGGYGGCCDISLGQFDPPVARRLATLDNLRTFNVTLAAYEFYIEAMRYAEVPTPRFATGLSERYYSRPAYTADPVRWRESMDDLLRDLRDGDY